MSCCQQTTMPEQDVAPRAGPPSAEQFIGSIARKIHQLSSKASQRNYGLGEQWVDEDKRTPEERLASINDLATALLGGLS